MPPRAEALPVERYPSLRHLPPTRDPVKAAASVAALVREWSPASKRCGLGRTIPQRFRIDKLAAGFRKLQDSDDRRRRD